MTALKNRIQRLIAASGPISVADCMALCLGDPEHGYYMSREPFGTRGDFTTAPEISQMFGELVGAWLAGTWEALGRPEKPVVAEIGPGRGTLMQDVLRTVNKIKPELCDSGSFVMIETSPRLVQAQKSTLLAYADRITWIGSVDDLPHSPLLIIGNELFDAVPTRQYVKTSEGWRERMVGLDEDGNLSFQAGTGSLDPALLPPGSSEASGGAVFEVAPARESLMQTIAEHIGRHGGAGLFLDYGHTQSGLGDTLQALRNHSYDNPLAHPGEADLTTHVDFSALAEVARRAGLAAFTALQGDFLISMGLLERAGQLGADASEDLRNRLRGEVERLAGPDQMGTLFKVLALGPRGTIPLGFTLAH
ncbi:class I SAM-dependent methyltransferase [Mesorhizobium sp. NBSH29]|uniref:class I SAM-dependent methyltransferase n=1 Tax=Mesorhizobium sp. NBSH29 TaxID=2654249 RepID=UPI001896406A|nr:class I SAM-dependent methyltransferase [Mesorhizobium sp. NBSH29]QPC88426.1 class I SAM-dependent methyltransferase [Mesorhizobium sp. NBSH29]